VRAFEAAARHMSFKEAADELGLTPTAISHQIRLLETLLGLALFRRRPRPLSLTSAGAALFPVVRGSFDAIAEAFTRVRHEVVSASRSTASTAGGLFDGDVASDRVDIAGWGDTIANPAATMRSDANQLEGKLETAFPPRLSLVVLPFANIAADHEQEYFAEGVTESLTTDLSRVSGAFVIAGNTAFAYKGKAIDLRQIGRDLNVRYALEGSVQRGGNRLRLNVQLIDCKTATHLWAERFDEELADLFEM
jgi:TolB-like protein